VDERADIYAVGIVLFFALTAELPFSGRNVTESMAHQLHSKAPPPSWFLDSLPTTVDQVVIRALRKEPGQRFASMIDLAQDLDRLLGGRGDELRAAGDVGPDTYEPRTARGTKVLEALRRALA
jgi:serine/threonine protein kinase